MFSAEAFLNQSVEGPLSTRQDPVPVGDYKAIADKLEVAKAGTGDDAKPILRVTWKLIDAGELSAIGREVASVRQDIWLDLDDEGTALDFSKGKNIGLGRVFEALGLNNGGATPGMIKGQMAIVHVDHRTSPKDPSAVFDSVTRVAAAT